MRKLNDKKILITKLWKNAFKTQFIGFLVKYHGFCDFSNYFVEENKENSTSSHRKKAPVESD